MDAEFIETEDEWIGVRVADNTGVEHKIAVEFDGGVRGHGQNGYPDKAAKRTVAENEHVNQAQRFAQFYVYRERGYDTVEPMRNPDYIALAAMAVAYLSDEQFESYFGDYYQQVQSEAGKAEPVVEVPDLPLTARLRIEQDIYIGLDDTDTENLTETLADADVFTKLQTAADRVGDDGGLVNELASLVTADTDELDEQAQTLAGSVIEALGPVRARWTANGTDQTETGESKTPLPDRDPEVRPQLLGQAYDLDSMEDFRETLLRHLLCQVRDCYITMGIAPPAYARIQGPGIYENIGWYSNHDIYPDYHDPNADISDWQEEHTPDDIHI